MTVCIQEMIRWTEIKLALYNTLPKGGSTLCRSKSMMNNSHLWEWQRQLLQKKILKLTFSNSISMKCSQKKKEQEIKKP